MKKLRSILIVLVSALTLVLIYSFSPRYNRYSDYTPYFMTRTDLDSSVSYSNGAREMVNPGKIYIKGNYIYINERYKGVHVIDNTNPASPKQVAFIVAPGCMDMAIKGDVMYVDNAIDLVAFNLKTKEVTERIKNFFPEPVSPNGREYYGDRAKGHILVGWKKVEK